MIHDREHYEGWERYLSTESRDLRARREGLLRSMLGMALPEERPEELERLARARWLRRRQERMKRMIRKD